MKRFLVALPALLACGCRTEPIAPRAWDLNAVLKSTSLRDDEPFRSVELRNAGGPVSQHLVVCKGTVPAHVHLEHDETVLLLRGAGDLRLGSEIIAMTPGVLAHVPAGTVHSFHTTSAEPAAALSCFTPAFDGKDRIFLESGTATPTTSAIDAADPNTPSTPQAHASLAGFFDAHFSGDAWRDDVFRDYLTAPPVILPLALGAGALAVSPWDDDVQRNFQGKLGNTPVIASFTLGTLVVGSLALGVAAPGPGRAAWDETWTQLEAFGLTIGMTSLLKGVVHKRRPGDSSSNAAFVSGHASGAFAAATLIEANSGPTFGIPAYGLAALTGFSRIEAGRHSPSDVLVGAALGTLVAGAIDALHFGTGREGKGIASQRTAITLAPSADGGMELALDIRF